ncbi:alkylated DNA repair protein alkB-like [Heracleum sosnowskyi]|uniref:Alkylated DNA repair protein alkB-like n=1 Tax=Heracleum sosnowskyi TaxID=360622 RepID=A0AAD8IJN1_9APIA|nr:alkylated DNA repair protein alkB-like [Heracleum sosnowskyi]
MEDSQQAILKDVFGESSESECETQETTTNNKHDFGFLFPKWEPISSIKGLWLCKDFLDDHQQSLLLSEIHKEGWFCEASHNQAMRFGDLPAWATEISTSVKETIQFTDLETCLFPPNLLCREPFFDQLIVNTYQPGEGICAHVDLMRFEDGIAIVSLESSCVMHFTRVESEATNNLQKVPVYLTPGSLVLMWGEARYLWKHEINRNPGIQIWEGENIDQKRRTSITLRKLCNTD